MNGAHDYAEVFGRGEFQRGKLLIVSGCHARGNYFHVYIVNADGSKTEVYGILGGHPGWTEYYGWLHHGQWESDFAKVCEEQKDLVGARVASTKAFKDAAAKAEQKRIAEN